jgi:Xaa-Pro aminopeptidase
MNRRPEVDRKVERLCSAVSEAGARGVLISTHWNFAWLTAGASNRIDIAREAGAGALLIGADGRRVVLANEIEMPRLTAEALEGLDFEPIAFPWIDERADPAYVVRRASDLFGGGPIAADLPFATAVPFEPALTRLRTRLEPEEVDRYRDLGGLLGRTVGDVLRTLTPGVSEDDVVREIGAAAMRAGTRPHVLLAAADDRLLRYRHPFPTSTVWRDRLMAAVCAERGGLIVAISRLVSAREPGPEIIRRLTAAQQVFVALLNASVPGASAASLFSVAAEAYAGAGFPREETRHHQGGGIGYKAREWIAHPASSEVLAAPTALAWNPSVTGTKVEDTCLVHQDGVENITVTPGWPSRMVEVRGRPMALAGHLELS